MAARLSFAICTISMLACVITAHAQETSVFGDQGRFGSSGSGGFVPAHEKLQSQTDASDRYLRVSQRPPPPPRLPLQLSTQPAQSTPHDVPARSGPAPIQAATCLAADAAPTFDIFESMHVADCPSPDWWVRADYLVWWLQGLDVPELATTGNANDPLPGALGQPRTETLFGGTGVNDHARSGGQITLGKWLCPCRCVGIEASYLTLGNTDTTFSATSNDFDILARPFFNTTNSAQDAVLISDPGAVAGRLGILADTQCQTAEILVRRPWENSPAVQTDVLIGYRFAQLDDGLRIEQSSQSLNGPTAGTTFDLFDQFETRNTFHGAEFGLELRGCGDPGWTWEALAKVAVGGARQRATISGETTTTDNAGNSANSEGGLLAQATNIGDYRRNDFTTLSEFGITLKRQLNFGLTARLGYSFLYWTNVARAGNQVDTAVNTTQIPPGTLTGAARPRFPFRTTDFWAHGLRCGLEYNF